MPERPEITRERLAAMIDHAVLSPSATGADVAEGCRVARELGLRSLVVAPSRLADAVRGLEGSEVMPVAVLGFPHGDSLPEAKAYEARRLADLGAREIDMVMNISALKSGDKGAVAHDIAGVVVSASAKSVPVKVIIESAALTDAEIETACAIARDAMASFVKTSTGFGPGGATRHAVELMRRAAGPRMGVKASGGIRTLADALGMIESGADVIGTSSAGRILAELA